MRFHIEDLSPAAPGGALPESSRVSMDEQVRAIQRWMQSTIMRGDLLAIYGRLGFGSAAFASNGDIESRLLAALRRGDLELIRRPAAGSGGGGAAAPEAEAEPAPEPEPAPAPKPKTWVEFQVIDEDDQPVVGVKYKVKLPNGQTREGTTRASGLIRFDDLEDGDCEIALPELADDKWEKE